MHVFIQRTKNKVKKKKGKENDVFHGRKERERSFNQKGNFLNSRVFQPHIVGYKKHATSGDLKCPSSANLSPSPFKLLYTGLLLRSISRLFFYFILGFQYYIFSLNMFNTYLLLNFS